MTKFADQLFDDLMREHGPALEHAGEPAAPKRRLAMRRPVLLAGGASGLAVAAAIGALVAATGGSPAYAVTAHSNGTVTVAVYQKSGIAGANARLRQLGDSQVVIVPVQAGCPVPAPPAVSGVGKVISDGIDSNGGSSNVTAQGIPAGDILIVGIESSANGGSASAAILSSPPAPNCISMASLPSSYEIVTHHGSGRTTSRS
jgi:hypothetical protein